MKHLMKLMAGITVLLLLSGCMDTATRLWNGGPYISKKERQAFEQCIYELPLRKMIRDGYLTPPRQIDAPAVHYDFSQLKARENGLFNEEEINRELKRQRRVTPRVVAQIVYYVRGYFAGTRSNDEAIVLAVPSGNFGNICAGHIARMMGVPIARLVLATNENDVLDEFFRTGVYRPRATSETQVTSSPSMDISKASNFERFVFDLVGRDPAVIRELWAKIDAGGSFDLSRTPHFERLAQFGFVSGKSSHADRLATIRSTYEQYGVMVDTHTADGLKVAKDVRSSERPMVVLETALAAKFEETIVEALGRRPERPAAMHGIEALPQRVEVMNVDVDAVKRYIERNVQG